MSTGDHSKRNFLGLKGLSAQRPLMEKGDLSLIKIGEKPDRQGYFILNPTGPEQATS